MGVKVQQFCYPFLLHESVTLLVCWLVFHRLEKIKFCHVGHQWHPSLSSASAWIYSFSLQSSRHLNHSSIENIRNPEVPIPEQYFREIAYVSC